MDPLSVISGVVGVISIDLKTATTLQSLQSRYQNASVTTAAMCSESTLVASSLAHIQTLFLDKPRRIETDFQSRPGLHATFDTALTGCMVVYSCLERELEKFASSVDMASTQGAAMKSKARLLWNEDLMNQYLTQLRGQQAALTLL